MLDLLYDYQNNVALYPEWQQYLRTRTPPALIDVFLDSHVIAPAPV